MFVRSDHHMKHTRTMGGNILMVANRMVRLASMFVLRVQKGSDDVSYIKICVLQSRFRIYRVARTNLKFSKNHFPTQKASTNQS